MSHPDDAASTPETVPAWALRLATEELYDITDAARLSERAREIAIEHGQLADERHDEYDDPDQGGEG